MSEFIQHLDADTTSDGVQFNTSMLQQFFDNDKDYLKRTKESRSTGVEKELLNLDLKGKKQLSSSIEQYLNNLNFELQSGQSCKITTLLSNYPSSFSEAMKAVKSGYGKSLNIACALLSLHSIITTQKKLHYEEASKYAAEYICNTNTPKDNNNKNTTITESPIKDGKNKEKTSTLPNQIDKIPTFLKQKIQGDETLNNCTLGDIQQDLKNNNYDLGFSGPNDDGVDGLRGEKTKKALENYFSKKSEKKDNVSKDSTSKQKDIPFKNPVDPSKILTPKGEEENNIVKPGTPKEKGEQETIIEKNKKAESLSENNNFEKEKAIIVSKTLEIQELVSYKTPKDIEDYIDKLRNDTIANPFANYMAIMTGLGHIDKTQGVNIIANYSTILSSIQSNSKERKSNKTGLDTDFNIDIGCVEDFLSKNSHYKENQINNKNNKIGPENSLLGLSNYDKNTKGSIAFDCSSYSFFVYCIMSDLGYKNIGIAENEKKKHAIFVRKTTEGSLVPYDFTNIEKTGESGSSDMKEGNMKDNIPANISLLISEYNPKNPTLYSTYLALIGSQYKQKNNENAYEETLYDDLTEQIKLEYQKLGQNKIIITEENKKIAQDILSIMMSEVHQGVKRSKNYEKEIKILSESLKKYDIGNNNLVL